MMSELRCRPGDLAIIVGYHPAYPHLTGRLVDVIEAAPVGMDFKLPDGKLHNPCGPGRWVICFQSPVNLNLARGRSNGFYACCHDRYLRPIRDPGEDANDEMVQKLGKPEAVTP
jgi:hypothetical protein